MIDDLNFYIGYTPRLRDLLHFYHYSLTGVFPYPITLFLLLDVLSFTSSVLQVLGENTETFEVSFDFGNILYGHH